jgi:hypothetical protein
MGRGRPVVRHLHRQHAAVGQEGSQPAEEVCMVIQPMQGRVGIGDIDRLVGLPGGDVTDLPRQLRVIATSPFDHLGGRIDTNHEGIGPAFGETDGQATRAAAEIDRPPRLDIGDSGDELETGTASLAGKPQVTVGIPYHHRTLLGGQSGGSRHPWGI